MITTMLHDGERNIPLENKELQGLLDEIRKESGLDWQVIKRSFAKRRWFRKNETLVYYEVLMYVGGCLPYQLLNFYKGDGRYSTFLTEAELGCYLMGLVNGIEIGEFTVVHVHHNMGSAKNPGKKKV